jgi:hypothetical protein
MATLGVVAVFQHQGARQRGIAPTRVVLGVLAAALLVAGAIAGCGGGDDDITREDSARAPSDSGASAGEAIDQVEVGGGFTPGLEDCASLSVAVSALVALPTTLFSGGADLTETVENLNARVPEELAGPYETLRSVFEEFAAGGPLDAESLLENPDAAQRAAEFGELFDSPEVEDALEAFDDFFAENCSGAVPDP